MTRNHCFLIETSFYAECLDILYMRYGLHVIFDKFLHAFAPRTVGTNLPKSSSLCKPLKYFCEAKTSNLQRY